MKIVSLSLLQLLCLGFVAAGEAAENKGLKQEDEAWYSRMVQQVNSLTPPPTPPPTRPPTPPPTPPPTRPPTPPPTPPPTLTPSQPSDLNPSSQPSECADVLEECPIDECFLPYSDASRPPSCLSFGRADCDVLPTPQNINCPRCCATECRPDNPMFTPSPDGSPPICSPTMLPTNQPTPPEPSSAPSDCGEVIEECPLDTCFLPTSDPARPPDCTAVGRPDCDVLPFPNNLGCPACCPFECSPDNPMFTPSPDGSPPNCSPTMLPSPSPSDVTVPLTPAPSSQPSQCAEVIEQCPIDECFLPYGDSSRPLDCTDPAVNRPDCDVLPTPQNINCPACCAFECRPDNPMFTPSPDGSPPICSPTMMPSPEPSSQPSDCGEVIEECPIDACFLPRSDSARPPDCTAVGRPDCNVLPFPNNIGCPACCPFECSPDNPMFTPSPDGSPPNCSPTMLPSPSPSDVTVPLTPAPSSAPTRQPSSQPTGPQPSSQPSECADVLELCPYDTCFLPFDDSSRPPDCTDPSVNRPDCDKLSTAIDFTCPTCCPTQCRPDNPMFSPSPDGSPPVCSPTMMPSPLPSPTEAPECGLELIFDATCEFACTFDICKERPYKLEFRYTGGGCEKTAFRRCPLRDPDPTPEIPNPDPCTCTKEDLPCDDFNNNHECEDFGVSGALCNSIDQFCQDQSNTDPIAGCGPPPSDVQHTVFIEVFGKNNEDYFSGTVDVNTTFVAETDSDQVSAITDIFTYEFTEGQGKGRLMQHVVFNTGCATGELFLTDQVGSQQLVEFDAFCTVACNDGGCIEVTENGDTFGRRRISLFAENGGAGLDVSLSVTSPGDDVELAEVLGLFTVSDFSAPTEFFNFADAVGKVVPPPLVLEPETLRLAVDRNYTIGVLVEGFLQADPSLLCQQRAVEPLTCKQVVALECECPPCDEGDGKGPKKAITLPSYDW